MQFLQNPARAFCNGAERVVRNVDGETGFVVHPDDAVAFADRLALIFADANLARELGDAGRRRVQEHFTLDLQVERTLDRYESLVAVRA